MTHVYKNECERPRSNDVPPRPFKAVDETLCLLSLINPSTMHPLSDHCQMLHKSHPADINRLLDPSYSSPPRASSSCSAYYVDPHDGDLHDPDYHIFPINITKPHSSHHPMPLRPQWEVTDDDVLEGQDEDELESMISYPFHPRKPSSVSSYTYQNHQRRAVTQTYPSVRPSASGYSLYRTTGRMPHYSPHSLDSEDTVLDECETDDGGVGSYILHTEKSTCSRIISRTKREFHKRRHSLENSSPPDFSPFSPPTPTSSPISDLADADADPAFPTASAHSHSSHHHPFTRTFSLQSHGRRSRASYRSEHEPFVVPDTSFTAEVDGADQEEEDAQREYHQSHHTKKKRQDEWTPTCTQALRMQWQALVLRVRLALFRAQKRLSKPTPSTGTLPTYAWSH